MVQALTEATFDPAGHDHSKTILMQAALTETPTKGAAADASDGSDGGSVTTPCKDGSDDSEGSTPSFAGDSLKSLDFDPDSPESTPTNAMPEGMPDDTIIIFDWDDTLLCSSAINTRWWDSVKLEELQETAERVLRTAARLGQVLIVTNGVDWWVDDSARRFLPGLLPLLDTLTVRSARASWECRFPGDPFAWKREEFREILQPRRRSTNLVVLGDSLAEIHAAQGVHPLLGDGSLVKTVKFKEAPSADQVIGQLRSVAAELEDIVQQRASSSRTLVQGGVPEQLLSMVGCTSATGWRLHETEVLEPRAPVGTAVDGCEGFRPPARTD